MSVSEKMSILGDFRKILQDFLAPELRELSANLKTLADNQKVFADNLRDGLKAQADNLGDGLKAQADSLRDGLKAQTDSQLQMEARLLREIKNSEEKILLMLRLSETAGRLEQVTRENEKLKREKTQ